jgi:hypothetical protein
MSDVPAGRGQVMVRGSAIRQAPIAPGDVFRLAELVLTCCRIAAVVRRPHEQGIGWSVGRG